jgi:hypothetical protein
MCLLDVIRRSKQFTLVLRSCSYHDLISILHHINDVYRIYIIFVAQINDIWQHLLQTLYHALRNVRTNIFKPLLALKHTLGIFFISTYT